MTEEQAIVQARQELADELGKAAAFLLEHGEVPPFSFWIAGANGAQAEGAINLRDDGKVEIEITKDAELLYPLFGCMGGDDFEMELRFSVQEADA